MHRTSPLNGVLPPFALPSDIIYFLDWRYVDHGYLRWLTPEGQSPPLMPAPTALPPLHTSAEWLPRGVRLATVPGTVDPAPSLTATTLGESLFFGGSVVMQDGVYRLFYESLRPGTDDPNHGKVLRLAESTNGSDWRFPRGAVAGNWGRHDNVVYDPGRRGYHGGGVFFDPHGPPAERYKTVHLALLTAEELAQYVSRWPDDVDPMALYAGVGNPMLARGYAATGICGAVSPDGVHWQALPEPMLVHVSDTLNTAYYDAALQTYVIYPRTWYYGRRAVGRAESRDFRHFGGLRQVLWPDAGMRPTDTWYTPGATCLPDAPEYRVMFPTLWSQIDDSFQPCLHTSPDGVLWQRTPGAPMVPLGPAGSWYHCGAAVPSLVPLAGDRMGSLMLGLHVPHKHPRVLPGFGQAGWVSWPRGRLVALTADQDGAFNLFPLRVHGRRLQLNLRTRYAGWVRVGVRVGERWLRPLADCGYLQGDHLALTVDWQGEQDLGYADGEAIVIRLELYAAELFSVRFV